MEPLSLILGTGLLLWMFKRESQSKVIAVPTLKEVKVKRVNRPKVKRSIVIVDSAPEIKIGAGVMPQGWSYPVPFNQPWVNVTAIFAG